MDILRQVAKGKCRRIVLEEQLPGLIVISVAFPVSEGRGKGSVRWAGEQNVGPRVFDVRSTELAMRRLIRVETFAVFSCRGVVRQCAGHTTGGLNVIGRECQEEAFGLYCP